MKVRLRFLLFFLLLPLLAKGQNHPSINSVFLFQYGAPESSLDGLNLELFDEKEYGDGHFYKVFMIDKESGTYAVIRFPDFRSNYVYGAQITGSNANIPLIEGLRLRDSKEHVFELLGQPSDSSYVADVEVMHYLFMNRNYSVEINSDGKLFSFAMHGDDGLLEEYDWPDNWQRYGMSSLEIETQKIRGFSSQDDNDAVHLVNDPIPFRPRVKFTGNTRPISPSHQKVIEEFSHAFDRTDIVELFKTEIEVVEGSTAYWLPMQELLLEDLFKTTNNGSVPIDIFVTYIGHTSDSITFLVNEFILW